MTGAAHWETVYRTKNPEEVSWYSPHLERSLELIEKYSTKEAPLIDVGGGTSTLVDDLLRRGYERVSVLDIAESALAIARERLGDHAQRVTWLTGDLGQIDLEKDAFSLWHDRAVLHFMTDEPSLEGYLRQMERGLKKGGIAVLSPFAADGPTSCSGLPVTRYDLTSLLRVVGPGYELLEAENPIHITPGGREQRFLNVVLRKR